MDYISSEAIESTGATETGKILQLLAPSFNFSATTISDGTDIIRPATLRALGPDQVLVLVNGKRRHQQALLNVQQTVARGSAGYDINAIPASAIDHIEVLRDGAAAQYGSDAIAGVINIILKSQTGETDFTVDVGQRYAGDGGVVMTGINTGFGIGETGFFNLTVEYRDRGETNRAGPDVLRVDPPRVTQRIGDADSENVAVWLNSAVPAGKGELYFFGGVSNRQGNSSGRSNGGHRAAGNPGFPRVVSAGSGRWRSRQRRPLSRPRIPVVGEVPGRVRGALRGLLRLWQHGQRQALRAGRRQRQGLAARHAVGRLQHRILRPCPLICVKVSSRRTSS